jgi:3-hydroxyisobutyrate dehydrogenase-like beta-hydroxyacid dehydrogenase
METAPMRFAILGLGEAGARIAGDLVAFGAAVTGYDPLEVGPGVPRAATATEAVAAADVVLALVPAAAVVDAAATAGAALRPGAIYADCAASGVAAQRAAAGHVTAAGSDFVDVALLGVIPATGIRTPALLSGPGAARLAPILAGFGMPAGVVSDRPGDATERKLLRSVFTKGLAAAVGEALDAARRLGCEDWLRGQIEAVLVEADGGLVDRFDEGTRRHARRRVDEMAAALELLDDHGQPAEVTRAVLARLVRLADAELA